MKWGKAVIQTSCLALLVSLSIVGYHRVGSAQEASSSPVAFKPQPSKPAVLGRLRLERLAGWSDCLSYVITIDTEGTVIIDGKQTKPCRGVSGIQVMHADPVTVNALFKEFEASGFFAMKDSYRAQMSDQPTTKLSWDTGTARKQVIDYAGAQAGMPEVISHLEQRVGAIADIDDWLKPPAHSSAR